VRLFGRGGVRPEPQPYLNGESEPHYSNDLVRQAAKEAFIDVLMKVPPVRRLPGENEGFADRILELDRAIGVARVFCNEELLRRMDVLREAAIEAATGGDAEPVRTAQAHFTLGCRLALGTND
jgi:hypothetical protein